MRFIIANDHAAIELKQEIVSWLKEQNHIVRDVGVNSGESSDYPDKGEEAARRFLEGGFDYGILCCGTGIGISIAANKIRGIRCALPQNVFAATMAKEHNNCQFIAFGSRIDYPQKPTEMLRAFLDAEYSNETKHHRRVGKIMRLESH